MAFAVDGEEHLVQVLLIARTRTPAVELIGIGLPELQAPPANRFVGHHNPTDEEQLFDIPIAQAEAIIEPDPVADNLGGKTMVFVAFRGGGKGHA
jgi:hypothetical protein